MSTPNVYEVEVCGDCGLPLGKCTDRWHHQEGKLIETIEADAMIRLPGDTEGQWVGGLSEPVARLRGMLHVADRMFVLLAKEHPLHPMVREYLHLRRAEPTIYTMREHRPEWEGDGDATG